jgi:hypothetical protein
MPELMLRLSLEASTPYLEAAKIAKMAQMEAMSTYSHDLRRAQVYATGLALCNIGYLGRSRAVVVRRGPCNKPAAKSICLR